MTSQDALPLQWPHRYGREDFIVGDCNKEAFEAVIQPDEWPIPVTLLLGPAAGGKTHLAHIFAEKHGASFIKDEEGIDKALVEHPLFLVVDDADKIGNDEKLFHLFNSVLTRKARLLLVAGEEPQHWIKLPDLLSRIKAAHYIEMQNPDEEVIRLAYRKLFTERGLFVDDKVLDYLAVRTERSFAGVLKNVDKLDRLALANKKRVTIPLIADSKLF